MEAFREAVKPKIVNVLARSQAKREAGLLFIGPILPANSHNCLSFPSKGTWPSNAVGTATPSTEVS